MKLSLFLELGYVTTEFITFTWAHYLTLRGTSPGNILIISLETVTKLLLQQSYSVS
jgi:hypothetical protein